MSETSFKIIREEEDLLAISLVGGDLNDFIVEFKDINIIYDGETSVNLEFDYSIIAEETSEITESKWIQIVRKKIENPTRNNS